MVPPLSVRLNRLACLNKNTTDILRGRSQFSGQSGSSLWKARRIFPPFAREAPKQTRRYASTAQEVATDARSLVTRLKNLFFGTAIGASLILGYLYITDTRAGVHQWVVVPSLRWLYDDAEDAHEAGTKALKALYSFGIHPRERGNSDNARDLSVAVFGHTLLNPIGTSAGIDKHAELPSALLALGPAIVEVGGATPYPQDGNPKPRVWRLPSQKGFINRYGLNSEGADAMAMRLRQRLREYAYSMGFGIDEVAEQRILDGEAGVPPGSLVHGKLLAVQVAKNSFTPDNDIEAIKQDYVYCVDTLAKYADIIVVNVSSPNTVGLRDLQKVEPLTNILTAVVEAAKRADRKTSPAVMVKVSPDEDSEEQIQGIVDAVWKARVDGIIVGNTTKRRDDLIAPGHTLPPREAAILLEQGGYSGPQLFDRTVSLVRKYRRKLDDGMQSDSLKVMESSSEFPKPKLAVEKSSSDNPTRSRKEGTVEDKIEATVQRDLANLKDSSPEMEAKSKSQPLIRLPARNSPSSPTKSSPEDAPALSSSSHIDQLSSSDRDLPQEITASSQPISLPVSSSSPLSSNSNTPTKTAPTTSSIRNQKVIFATGGITNGKQALEVLEAGANVAQIYTALIYSGVGTISRIKDEMRQEMKSRR
ncbi:Dihydroorotate dehydrogenase (quinone), mitochondrial [Xylographa trunciseda]|nr:Dihydroorotate dehydrogenase (quinone), mitochondrial [Xylographa trunciseda]